MSFLRLIRPGLITAILFIGCQKDKTDSPEAGHPGGNGSGSNLPVLNPRLKYEDTLFHLNNQPGDYTVLPVTKPNATGYFKAIPSGLALDSATGSINISDSESGLRYKIYYISPAGIVLDSTRLVISGVDYKDAIVEIATTPSRYDTVFPVYDAIHGKLLPCADDDDDDDGGLDDDDNGCVFDETDLNGDGNDDIAGVIQDKLLLDIKKGTIDVEASFHAGIFGSSNPANGLVKDFTFYYRLDDASNRALNKITVRMYHYRRRSDIPAALMDTLNYRAAINSSVNARTSIQQNAGQESRVAFNKDYALKPKRPPIIVIVSR